MEGILSELQGALEILFCNAPGEFWNGKDE